MDDLYTATSIKSGYLHKKGERRRAWQKRFFVLRPRSLGYYKDSKEYKLLRQIPLQDMKTCAQVQVQKHDYVFGIVTAERNFYIQASSNHERDEWVQAINEAIRRANAMDTGLASDVLHEDDLNTPQGYDSPGLRTSANTQQQQQTTRPIAITGGRQSRGAYEQTQSHSLVSTTGSSSVSAFSPTGHPEPPSSYTSQPSSTQASYTGNGLSSVSPIPYAVSPPRSVPLHESSGGDVTLERLADTPSMSKHRQYSNSTTDSYIGQPGNFDTIRRSSGGVPQSPRPPTISSSEDDEDDAEMPTTPLSASGQELEIVQSPVLSPTQPPPAHSPAPIAKPNAQSKLKEQPGPAESHHPDPAKVVLAGYLTKQGKRRNWRKRWFSLSSTALSYSRSHMVSASMAFCVHSSALMQRSFRTRKCIIRSLWGECWM